MLTLNSNKITHVSCERSQLRPRKIGHRGRSRCVLLHGIENCVTRSGQDSKRTRHERRNLELEISNGGYRGHPSNARGRDSLTLSPLYLSLPFSLCIHKADVLCSFDGAASTPPPPATLSSCSHSLRLSLCRKFTVGKFGILSQLRRAGVSPLSLSHLSTRIGAPCVRASPLFPYGEHTRRN